MKHNGSKQLFVILTTLVLTFSALGVTRVRATTLTVTTTADSGPGSLRQTIADATAGDTITFDSSLSGATIYVASVLVIDKEVTIDGSTLAIPITISGDSDNNGIGDVRVFYVNYLITAKLDSLIITKGNFSPGGGLVNSGFLTIVDSTFSNNISSFENVGGIYNGHVLTVLNSTFTNNSARGYGGAIYNGGIATITNSTFSGNAAGVGGGGIYNGRTLTVTNTTLSNNAANNNGGGAIFNADGGTLYLNNSILANSTAGADCENYPGGVIAANISSLIETNSAYGHPCGVPSLTSDPMLEALADNGGHTQTHALSVGSPAIDAGDNSVCAADPVNNLDQRGMPRSQGSHCDIGAYEADVDSTAPLVNTFEVTSPTNKLDIPITSFTASDNVGVVGYLITESPTQPGNDDYSWGVAVPSTYTVTSTGTYTLYPWVKDKIGIVSAVFESPRMVIVDQTLPVVNNFDALIPTNTLNIQIASFTASDNVGVSKYLITESPVQPAGNNSNWSVSVPGIYRVSTAGIYTLYPWVKDGAGNISTVVDRPLTVLVDNIAPIMETFAAPLQANSLAIPVTSFAASDNVEVVGYLITESSVRPESDDASWSNTVPSVYSVSKTGVYYLYPWVKDSSGNVSAVFGSPQKVLVCFSGVNVNNTADSGPGSLRQVVTDACPGETIIFDERIVSGRTIYMYSTLTIDKDLTIDGSMLSAPITIIRGGGNYKGPFYIKDGVTVGLDSLIITNPTYGGVQQDGGAIYNEGTLSIANTTISNIFITGRGGGIYNLGWLKVENSNFSSNSAFYGGAIYNEGNLIIASSDFTANSASNDGGGVYNKGSMTVTDSTFLSNSSSRGGAIFTDHVDVTITHSTFSSNSAQRGAGLYAVFFRLPVGDTLIISDSTFSGNSASDSGGGIYNNNPMVVVNSTFSANSASSYGGGIYNYDSSEMTVTNSTLSANSAGSYGGGIFNSGSLSLRNSILANSISGFDCYNSSGSITNVNTLIEDDYYSCGSSPLMSDDPMLGPLADNGGPTKTHALLAGSPAIDAGDALICAADPVNNLDQRGVLRPQGLRCDIGAFEANTDVAVPVVDSFSILPQFTLGLEIPVTSFVAFDNVGVTGYLITESSIQPALSDPNWSLTIPVKYVVPVDGTYTLYPWVRDAAGNISKMYTFPGVSVVDTTSPVVKSITIIDPNPTNNNSVRFTVTFSEPVTGVDVSDFWVTYSGISSAAVTSVSVNGTGAEYIATVYVGTGNGSLRLDLKDNESIRDSLSNWLGGYGPFNGDFTAGQSYTVSKRLIAQSIAPQDGWILESSATSNQGGKSNNLAQVFILGDDAAKRQYLGILSFKTSPIPDNAVITNVTLKFRQNSAIGNATFDMFKGLMVDIKKGSFGLSDLEIADFQAVPNASYGPFKLSPAEDWYSISLFSARGSINTLSTLKGLTQLRLRFRFGDNNDMVANYIRFFSGNAATEDQPHLIVDYYVP